MNPRARPCIPAVPLALLTLEWLRSAGAAPSRRTVKLLGMAWLLLLANLALALLLGGEMGELYPLYAIVDVTTMLFPVALFVVVLVSVLRIPKPAGLSGRGHG